MGLVTRRDNPAARYETSIVEQHGRKFNNVVLPHQHESTTEGETPAVSLGVVSDTGSQLGW